jgi:NADH-quinone oxidoreductase subunit N
MAGIPIFSGFFAKFILFTQTIQTGYLSLVIIAVINSIISVGYYFKLIIAMYTKPSTQQKQPVPIVYTLVAVLAILLNIIIGIYPTLITQLLA